MPKQFLKPAMKFTLKKNFLKSNNGKQLQLQLQNRNIDQFAL